MNVNLSCGFGGSEVPTFKTVRFMLFSFLSSATAEQCELKIKWLHNGCSRKVKRLFCRTTTRDWKMTSDPYWITSLRSSKLPRWVYVRHDSLIISWGVVVQGLTLWAPDQKVVEFKFQHTQTATVRTSSKTLISCVRSQLYVPLDKSVRQVSMSNCKYES